MRPAPMDILHMSAAIILLLALFACLAEGIVTEQGSLLNSCGRTEPIGGDMLDCSVENYVAIYDVQNYTVQVAKGSMFSMQIQLSSLGFNGDADLYLYGPNGLAMSSTERIGQDIITLPPSIISSTPGIYTIQVVGYQTYTYFHLGIQTPSRFPVLVDEEVKQLATLLTRCCDASEEIQAPICATLQKASSSTRLPEDDMCSQPPNLCDADGHLSKLSLVGGDGGNLVCPMGFPTELGGFKNLVELDMSSNNMIGSLESVAEVIGTLPYLQRLFLRRNSFSGDLDCSLLNSSTLQVLWLGGNTLGGRLPACLWSSTTMQQLSLEGNMLSGTMPPFPVGSPLILVDLSNNKAGFGPSVSGTAGISGGIPSSLSNLKGLLYFDVSGNKLQNVIPAVPVSLQTLSVSDNLLTGPLPVSLNLCPNLRSLQASDNKLDGPVPASLGAAPALMSLRLGGNKLSGGVPPYWQNQLLREFNISSNNLKFDMPISPLALPQLQVYDVSGNEMVGNLTRLAQNIKKSMVLSDDGHNQLMVFNVSGNKLTGGAVPADLMHMRLFNFVDPMATQSTDTWDPASPKMQSTFDISNTDLEAPFPVWLIPTLQDLYSLGASSLGNAVIKMNGGNNLSCPKAMPGVTGSSFFLIEDAYNLSCTTVHSSSAKVSDAIGLTLAAPPPPVGTPIDRGQDDGGSSGGTGIIVGIVVTVVVAIAAAIAGWYWWKKRKDKKSGRSSSRRMPLTFNSAYDPTAMSDASGLELHNKEQLGSNAMHANPMYTR